MSFVESSLGADLLGGELGDISLVTCLNTNTGFDVLHHKACW